MKSNVRSVLAAILAVTATIVLIVCYAKIGSAQSTNAANDLTAESAPQQAVVNGLIARDLIAILTRGVLLELFLVILGIALFLVPVRKSEAIPKPGIPPSTGLPTMPEHGGPAHDDVATSVERSAETVPPMVRPTRGALGDVPIRSGSRLTLGMVVPRKRDNFYFLAPAGSFNRKRYSRRFPLTDDGWVLAWQQFAAGDPEGARSY